jgi:D-alanyl-D-alanine carboxypeptidase
MPITTLIEPRLTALLDKFAQRADTGPISFALASPRRGWSWAYESARTPKPYFTASLTKLYTAAVVMQLAQERRVDVDWSISDYLDSATVAGLNTFRGVEHSSEITVRHLLAHTSGIAGYFDQKRTNGTTLLSEVLTQDRSWAVGEALDIAKHQMSAHFAPGAPGKAFYSDTNYHLLGLIIERLTGASYARVLRDRILTPLGLHKTWSFEAPERHRYRDIAPMLYGHDPVQIPLAMSSVGPHGGLVSTAQDGVTFLRAFIGGELFDPRCLVEMQRDWNRIFFPLRYGVGLMRYSMPRILSPGPGPRDYIGHSGSSGTVLFYAPAADLYVSGNISQIKNRALVYQLVSRLGAIAR